MYLLKISISTFTTSPRFKFFKFVSFNNSIFYNRFYKIVKKLNFKEIFLKQDLDDAAELVFSDRKHLDNNPQQVSKKDIVFLLKKINDREVFNKI